MKAGDLVAYSAYRKNQIAGRLRGRQTYDPLPDDPNVTGVVIEVSEEKTCGFMDGNLPPLPYKGYPRTATVMWSDGVVRTLIRPCHKWIKKSKTDVINESR